MCAEKIFCFPKKKRNMPEKKEVDDNDEEAIDAETYRAREWEEFKDANPRGWGMMTLPIT